MMRMNAPATVYGPVESWRVGRSLGVDLLYDTSVCSFRCVYCQLGRINLHTSECRVYVTTERVLADLEASSWREADCITLSGSGEPTLAANLGEVVCRIKALTRKPVLVLTNATKLNDAAVRRDLASADEVFCKLDAADERTFKTIARPVAGITLGGIVRGIRRFSEEYTGRLAVQIMLTRLNWGRAEAFARLLNEIRPDEVQLNAALRPVPRRWFLEARGNDESVSLPSVHVSTMNPEEAARFESRLHSLTGLKIVSVYRRERERAASKNAAAKLQSSQPLSE
jgi:wyosine [tRNA(Phe)-imidazoG37] synthetase (radical SAM superfamily)